MNYNESSGDEYDSPLVSPTRPPPTRAGSPALLAVPTLNDNVDEELAIVSQTLSNVGHTHTYRGTRPSVRPDPEGGQPDQPDPEPGNGVGEEEVVEGHIVGAAENPKVAEGDGSDEDDDGNNNQAARMVNYDAENKDDSERAAEAARHIKVEFDANNIRFWFSELEGEMVMAGVGKQWLKKTILQRNLPAKVKEDVMAYLSLPQDEADATIYLTIKTELLRIYAP